MRLRRHISASPPETGRGWQAWCRAAPRIVAESLAAADPLRVGLVAGAPAAPAEVARAIAAKLTPAERERAAPGWLLKGQQRSYRRVLAALDRYGGALLANAVGSGKTYIALAAAAAYRSPAVCLAPAALVPQWRALAAGITVITPATATAAASSGTTAR